MRYHEPSIPAIECSQQVQDNTAVLICPSCGDTMQHRRTIPKLGARLEQFIFVCPSCEQVETKEVKRGGKAASVGTCLLNKSGVLPSAASSEPEISCVSISVASSASNSRNQHL